MQCSINKRTNKHTHTYNDTSNAKRNQIEIIDFLGNWIVAEMQQTNSLEQKAICIYSISALY